MFGLLDHLNAVHDWHIYVADDQRKIEMLSQLQKSICSVDGLNHNKACFGQCGPDLVPDHGRIIDYQDLFRHHAAPNYLSSRTLERVPQELHRGSGAAELHQAQRLLGFKTEPEFQEKLSGAAISQSLVQNQRVNTPTRQICLRYPPTPGYVRAPGRTDGRRPAQLDTSDANHHRGLPPRALTPPNTGLRSAMSHANAPQDAIQSGVARGGPSLRSPDLGLYAERSTNCLDIDTTPLGSLDNSEETAHRWAPHTLPAPRNAHRSFACRRNSRSDSLLSRDSSGPYDSGRRDALPGRQCQRAAA